MTIGIHIFLAQAPQGYRKRARRSVKFSGALANGD